MSDIRAKCHCGNLVEKMGFSKRTQQPIWGKECRSCRGRYKYGIIKASICNICGFQAIIPAQLEIDHIDGNRLNNDKQNLQTICANCHALKSYINGDYRFTAEENPFFNKKHSLITIEKIKNKRNNKNVSKI